MQLKASAAGFYNYVGTKNNVQSSWKERHISVFYLTQTFLMFIQCVPLATEPGISLIILQLIRILQRNLKRTYLIV